MRYSTRLSAFFWISCLNCHCDDLSKLWCYCLNALKNMHQKNAFEETETKNNH